MKTLLFITLGLALLPTVTHAACPDGKTYPVHFTFDDGPNAVLTPKVLDILKEEKVPSTFFVLGTHFRGGKKNPANKTKYALLDRMKKEGHQISSHTYEHINHPKFSKEEIKENILKPYQVLKDYLNPIVRLPYGGGSFRSKDPEIQAKNDMVMNTIKDAGLKHLGWDIDTNDWDARKRPTLLPTLLKDICKKKGGVVLFHDVQKFTVDNLKDWIKAVKAEGHSFVGLEKFVPEANDPLPPEACGEPQIIPKEQIQDIKQVLDRVKDEDKK